MSEQTQTIQEQKRIKGLAIIVKGSQIKRINEATYKVKSQSNNGFYTVIKGLDWKCECPSYAKLQEAQVNPAYCKHINSVLLSLELRSKAISEHLFESPEACVYCGSKDIVKRGIRQNKSGKVQRFTCKACGKRFVIDNGFAKMRNTPKAITLAMDLYFKGVSLRKITDHLKQFYGAKVHYSTVLRWIRKYIEIIKAHVDDLTPEISKIWHADEMAVKINGTGTNEGKYNYQ